MEVSGSPSNEGHRYCIFDPGQFTETPLLLYLFHSHTAPLHKPDSPLSKSWCKQQGSFMSGRSRAGEWISNRWRVICIGSKEGLGCDLTKKRNLCRCNSWAPQALGFVLCVIPTSKSQSDSYPDRWKTTPASQLNICGANFYQWQTDKGASGKHHLILCPLLRIGEGSVTRPTTALSISLKGCFFLFISLTLCCCPLTGLQGCHFSFKERLSGWLGLTLYLLLLRSLKGESPVAPCWAAMSIVCLHTE